MRLAARFARRRTAQVRHLIPLTLPQLLPRSGCSTQRQWLSRPGLNSPTSIFAVLPNCKGFPITSVRAVHTPIPLTTLEDS